MSVTKEPDEPLEPADSARPGDAPTLARRPRAMSRSVLAAALIGAGLVAGLAVAAVWAPGTQAPVDATRYAQFCTPVPAAAVAPNADASDHRIDVVVPRNIVAPDLDGDAHATQIARGEVVEFRITAPIEGAASVHGLSDLVLMKPGEPATLRFRAIYSGRFPLHFHGADGSHIGVWALNISPPPS
jgi:hypothetical protein